MTDERFCVVLTTTNSEDNVEVIAALLLHQQLAACIQIVPIQSKYVWQGKIESGAEHLLLIKAKAADFDDLKTAIASVHSYQVPEIISLPVEKGAQSYLDWILSATRRNT
jgi:periplasmic divalent cation tolerance protein